MAIVPFYKYSRESAKSNGQTDLWRESHNETTSCKSYIDSRETGLSATAFDGFHVDKDNAYAKNIIEKFGYQRCMHVLACTINENKTDGRYSLDNKTWAEKQVGWLDKKQNREYMLNTHPGLVDILAKNVRQEFDKLGLYSAEHCEPDSHAKLDYENQVLVIQPEYLPEEYWQPENQLFYAKHGFGCNPESSGRKVFGQYLSDDEKSCRNRAEFIGVLKDEFLPDWVREKLQELQNPQEPDSEQNNGMEMNM